MLSVQGARSAASIKKPGIPGWIRKATIVATSTIATATTYYLGTKWPTAAGIVDSSLIGAAIPMAIKGISLGVRGFVDSRRYRFKLERTIGAGAMGTVVKVYDRLEEKTRALKFPKGEMLTDPRFQDAMNRFYFEANVCSQLSHPNILKGHGLLWIPTQIFNKFAKEDLDPKTIKAVPAILMDYLEGMSLRDKINQTERDLYHEGLSISYSCGIALQLVEALICLREGKLIHRDLKPGNIILSPLYPGALTPEIDHDVRMAIAAIGEIAIIFDFGVARLEGPEGGFGTRTDMGIGSPYYMSSEQWKGKAQKESDVYAIGAILWECITGIPARGLIGEDETAMDYKVRAFQPVPEIEPFLPIDVPLGDKQVLQKIFTNTLNSNPQMRYQNLGLFKEDLKSLSFIGRTEQTQISSREQVAGVLETGRARASKASRIRNQMPTLVGEEEEQS